MDTRIATEADLDGLTATLTAAFERDPLWGTWAFPDPADLAVWWRFYLRSDLRYRCVWVRGDYAAASVWIPPGGTELTEEDEERVEPLLEQLVGARAPEVMELVERFDALATPEKRYSKCRIGPLMTVIGAEQSVWHCCVQRGQPFFSLGSLKDKTFQEVWAEKRNMADEIDVTTCPRCRYDGYNQLIEDVFVRDTVHANFV